MLLSKRPEMFLPEKWPTYFRKAKGCSVWDLDGNEFADMSIMGIGTNILGCGNRLFELGLSEVGLALCAASSKSDQTLITNLVAEHGREGFLAAWLRARDAGWAADLIPTFPISQAAKES